MSEVSVSGSKPRVRVPRPDKVKKHNYPKTRVNWLLGNSRNLNSNGRTAKGKRMKYKAPQKVVEVFQIVAEVR